MASPPRRRLPSLNALRAFEAAARHRSFKRGAAELAVTPTAISHQIRALEEELGVRLFERRARSVRLTSEGERLFPVLRDGLDDIARVIEIVTRPSARRTVTISATATLTARRLVPQVDAFREAFPAFDLRLHASNYPVDLRAGEADVAIRYGRGPHPGLAAEPLLADAFAPVFSPRLAIERAEDLLAHPLLEFEWRVLDADTPTWSSWLARAGLAHRAASAPRVTFSDESHAVQAALAAQGVAMLSTVMIEDELASGALVRPFGPVLPGLTHWLVYDERAEDREEITAVRAWLRRIFVPSCRSAEGSSQA